MTAEGIRFWVELPLTEGGEEIPAMYAHLLEDHLDHLFRAADRGLVVGGGTAFGKGPDGANVCTAKDFEIRFTGDPAWGLRRLSEALRLFCAPTPGMRVRIGDTWQPLMAPMASDGETWLELCSVVPRESMVGTRSLRRMQWKPPLLAEFQRLMAEAGAGEVDAAGWCSTEKAGMCGVRLCLRPHDEKYTGATVVLVRPDEAAWRLAFSLLRATALSMLPVGVTASPKVAAIMESPWRPMVTVSSWEALRDAFTLGPGWWSRHA